MSAFGSGPSNGQFWYGSQTNFPGFLYKKNVGVGSSSIANRRAKNRLASVCGGTNGNCFPCYMTLRQYSNYTHNPNGFIPCPINSNSTI